MPRICRGPWTDYHLFQSHGNVENQLILFVEKLLDCPRVIGDFGVKEKRGREANRKLFENKSDAKENRNARDAALNKRNHDFSIYFYPSAIYTYLMKKT